MKLKKIVTFIITAAAAAACTAALLSVNAGAFTVAEDYWYHKNGTVYTAISGLDEYLTYYMNDNIYYISGYDTDNNPIYQQTNITPTEINLTGTDAQTVIAPSQLAKLNGFTKVTATVTGTDFDYTIYLRNTNNLDGPIVDFFANGSNDVSIDVGLGYTSFNEDNTSSTANKVAQIYSKIYENGANPDRQISYKIPIQNHSGSTKGGLQCVLDEAGVDSSGTVGVYYNDSNISKDKQYYLSSFKGNETYFDYKVTFNVPENHKIKSYFYKALSKSDMESILDSSDVESYLKDKIAEMLGLSSADISDPSVSGYISDVTKTIMSELFTYDSATNTFDLTSKKFATKDDIDDKIESYYTTDADKDTHLKALADALIGSANSKAVIDKEIYDAFGISVTEAQVAAIKENIIPTLMDKIMADLFGSGATYSQYKDAIRYYLSGTTQTEIKSLKDQLSALLNNASVLDSSGNQYSDIGKLINDLYSYQQTLKNGIGTTPSFTELANQVSKATSFLNGETRTLSQILSSYATRDDLNNYAKNDGNINTTNINDYISDYTKDYVTEKDLNSYITYSEFSKLLQNQGVAYRSEINSLTNQLNTLNAELTKLQENYDALKKYNPYLYDNYYYNGYYYNGQYYNLSDWAVARYGSLDNFMNAVTNEVIRKLGTSYSTNGTSGESAYDIAVRNGFKGTEKAWLNSLVGASAYDIAVQNGFTGSETAWLNSLRGADGKDGVDGKDGKDGRDGVDGRDGRDGADGKDGKDGTSSTTAESTGRVVYVYGNRASSAAPEADTTPDKSVNDTAAYINGNTTNSGTKTAAAVSNVTAPAAGKTANPSTGVAAGIIIPAAAAASLFLAKKDKRKRGRK